MICYLNAIYFDLLKYSLFQYYCSPKNWVVGYQIGWCYVLSSLTHLGVNTRK